MMPINTRESKFAIFSVIGDIINYRLNLYMKFNPGKKKKAH